MKHPINAAKKLFLELRNCSAYVLERREHPELRTERDNAALERAREKRIRKLKRMVEGL